MRNYLISVAGIEPAFTNPFTATCLEDRTDYTDTELVTHRRVELLFTG